MTPLLTSRYGADRIRTAAFLALSDTLVDVGVNDAAHSLRTCPASPETLSAAAALVAVGSILIGVNLVDRARLDAWLCAVTSPPKVPSPPFETARPPEVVEAGEPMARRAVGELKTAAQLTNEEVALLAGVSRRSVQAWISGGAISGPKEQHLRSVAEAVRELAVPDAAGTRARLFDRRPGCVRPYDLLIEGRFEAAVALATGKMVAGRPAVQSPPSNLAAQFDHYEDRVDVPERSLNRTLSGRLRR